MLYAEALFAEGARIPLPAEHEDRGLYITEGEIEIAGERFEAGRMMVFRPGDEITISARRPSRLMMLGGETLNGPRYIWWNIVASSRDRIEAAKAAWTRVTGSMAAFSCPRQIRANIFHFRQGEVNG